MSTSRAAGGVAGFAGIPFNNALSTFIYYCTVQSVAMSYGYDEKNDSAERTCGCGQGVRRCGEPTSSGENGISDNVAKSMAINAVPVVSAGIGALIHTALMNTVFSTRTSFIAIVS